MTQIEIQKNTRLSFSTYWKNIKTLKIMSNFPIMLWSSVILSLLTSTTIVVALDVRQTEVNGSRMLATSEQNYAISSPQFLPLGVRCVSINGPNVVIAKTDTPVLFETVFSSIDPLLATSIEQIRQQMSSIFMFGPWGTGSGIHVIQNLPDARANLYSGSSISSATSSAPSTPASTISAISASSSSFNGGYNNINNFVSNNGGSNGGQAFSVNENGLSIQAKDNENFSLARANLPFNWARIFVNGDLITTITLDGQVLMRPLLSMTDNEQETIGELKGEVEHAREQFHKRMVQFTQSMRQFTENLHTSLMNPLQAINGIFGNMPGAGAGVGIGAGTGAFAGAGTGAFASAGPMAFSGATAGAGFNPLTIFGDNFPFGPNNSPFGDGFPFNG